MSALAIGLIVIVIMVVLLFLGLPLGITFFFTSALGFLWVGGMPMLMNQFSSGIFSLSASYSFAVIPLFLVVGILAGDTGIASGAYSSARTWLGKMRGGLLYTTVVANTLFGAVSGVPSAGNVVFSKIAYPELKKNGYDSGTSLACICSAGALSALIPPSMSILMFCILAEISIGDALVAGTAGGILLTVVLCITIWIVGKISPAKIPKVNPADAQYTFKDKLKSLRLLVPLAAIFAFIIGGSFAGWFPATVGGAIAVVILLIYALFKRIPIKVIANSIWEGTHDFAGLYLMVLGGQLFGRFITVSGIPSALVGWISGLAVPGLVVYLIIVIFYLICGCLMDCMSILIITIPIIFPLLRSVGFDDYIICIALVFLANLGGITPPVGMSVFQTAAVTGERTGVIFRGIIPFFIAFMFCVFLIAIFPNSILWLLKLLGG
ncbi:MAG: TRAP transporter large permease subunit [Oscillospiraceae bacterium]|nr:TRAP transporter large permease subunit [Oscillospiraceae bacterium]